TYDHYRDQEGCSHKTRFSGQLQFLPVVSHSGEFWEQDRANHNRKSKHVLRHRFTDGVIPGRLCTQHVLDHNQVDAQYKKAKKGDQVSFDTEPHMLPKYSE